MAQLLSTTVTGNLTTTGVINAGIASNVNVTSINYYVAQFNSNANTFGQVSVQNQNPGTNASSDLVATSDDGTDSAYFIDVGINSSGYNDPAYTIMKKHDGYIYVAGGNLTIGTAVGGLANDVVFHANGTLSTNESMRIYGANLNIKITNNVAAGNISTTNIAAGNITITQNVSSGNLSVTTNITSSNYIIAAGNLAFSRGGTLLANIPQITVGTTAHSSPRVGDLWVDTN